MGEIFNVPITETTTIWEDNQSAIAPITETTTI
jgi:hypothetical protein